MNHVTHRPHRAYWVLAGALAGIASCADCDIPFSGQNHVFDAPIPTACRTVDVPKKIEVSRSADILFVIDNSGSMAEEQANLRTNASSITRGGACNTASDVAELKAFITDGAGRGISPDGWIDPVNNIANGQHFKDIFDDCGFIERLLLFDNDFQIGVIFTDMRDEEGNPSNGACLTGNYPNGRSRLPSRGCLVPVPGGGRLVTARDGDIATVSSRFRSLIDNVATCGSGVEEGLESMKAFLSPDTVRGSASCNNDLQNFLREADCLRADGGACVVDSQGDPVQGPQPKLVVILLSDEQDCSTTNSPDGGPQTVGLTGNNTVLCYTAQEFLHPISRYTDFLRGLKNDPSLVSVATIVGGVKTGDDRGAFTPGDCRCNGAEANAAPITQCDTVRGNSLQLCGSPQPDAFCGALPPAGVTPPGGTFPCCTADNGSRYASFARGMDSFILDSICSQNYKSTMIAIANLINESDVVALGEQPQDPKQMEVEVKVGENGEFRRIRPWTGATSDSAFLACNGCTGNAQQCGSGYALINNCTAVKFLGSDIPPEGAEIRVRFLGAAAPGGPRCQ